jgi:hypothetical protein
VFVYAKIYLKSGSQIKIIKRNAPRWGFLLPNYALAGVVGAGGTGGTGGFPFG